MTGESSSASKVLPAHDACDVFFYWRSLTCFSVSVLYVFPTKVLPAFITPMLLLGVDCVDVAGEVRSAGKVFPAHVAQVLFHYVLLVFFILSSLSLRFA